MRIDPITSCCSGKEPALEIGVDKSAVILLKTEYKLEHLFY